MHTWEEFKNRTPMGSIALDGMVKESPNCDLKTLHFNFDHHNNVVREATMSTAMQVFFAIKGGLFESFKARGLSTVQVYINDTDQDTALAVWLLKNYKLFEGTQSVPCINRLLALTDRLDITGGAFPMNLEDDLIELHNWVFEPYTNLRKSGGLASASEPILRDNLESVLSRLTAFMMGQGKRKELDTRHEILYDNGKFKIVNEIGGNEARYYLFSKGMDAFVSLVATRPDGKFVYTIGKRSQYIPFPVRDLYKALNKAEGLPDSEGWNGSDIIGGSHRSAGSSLTWEQIKDILNEVLKDAD